jgi:hypothetical protein
MTKNLKVMRETRDFTDVCQWGRLYHVEHLIGPQSTKLLAKRVAIMSQQETNFVHVWDANLAKDPKTDLASRQEIKR